MVIWALSLFLIFKSRSFGGKTGGHTKVQRHGLPEAAVAAIWPVGDALTCGHLPLGGLPFFSPLHLRSKNVSEAMEDFGLQSHQHKLAAEAAGFASQPTPQPVGWWLCVCLWAFPAQGWGGAVLAVRSFWKPFLLWQFKFMWFLIVCKQSLLNPAPSLHPRSAGIQRWLLI